MFAASDKLENFTFITLINLIIVRFEEGKTVYLAI